MKRTFWKNVLRTLRSTMSRFLAIFAIVALGVGFLAGLLASPDDMRLSADRYYDDYNIYDFRVLSTLGLTDEDVQAVAELEGVEAVQAGKDMDLVTRTMEGDLYTTRLHTMAADGSDGINKIELVEGRLPQAPGECVVLQRHSFMAETQWVGQALTVEPAKEELPETLTVVGVAKSPLYFSMESERSQEGTGTVELPLVATEDTVDTDYKTALYVTVSGARELNAFTEEYDDVVQQVRDRLEELGPVRAKLRGDSLRAEGEEKLAEAQAEYDEKKAEVEQQLADAEQQLEDARAELEEGRKQLDDGKAEIEKGEKEYQQKVAEGKKAIEDGEKELTAARQQLASGQREYDQAVQSAQAQLADAQAQLDDARRQLDAGRAQLQEGKAQLDAGWAELAAGEEKIREGEIQLADAKQRLDDARHNLWYLDERLVENMLADSIAEYNAGVAKLEAAKQEAANGRAVLQEKQQEYDTQAALFAEKEAEYNSGAAELAYRQAQGEQELANARAQLEDGRRQIAEGEKKLADGRQELADGEKEYNKQMAEAQATLAENEQKWQDGKAELEKGEQEYLEKKEEAEEKLADGAKQLREARNQLKDINEGKWYVFTRQDSAGFSGYGSNADKIAAIAKVFPAFFFLVAALVALTTMTRLVEEERSQVGALKSLGYSSGAIAAKYLLYAAAASLLGSGVGLVVGMKLFPTVIIRAYGIMYDVPQVVAPFQAPYALMASLAATACVLLATLSACWAELREAPARLLLPKAPKAGKRVFLERITPLWRRMKFTHKVAARNLIRYKKRFFMTVIGIAGCTALLVTGFGLRDSIFDLVDLQFRQLTHGDMTVYLSGDDELEDRDLQKILADSDRVAGWMAMTQDVGTTLGKDRLPVDDVRLTVPEDLDSFAEYYTLRHRTDHSPVEFGEGKVVVTEKVAERQHWKVGDTITVKNQDGDEGSLTITDICENYVYHYIYLTRDTYREAFGEDPMPNTVLLRLPEGRTEASDDQISRDLLASDGVSAAVFTEEISENFDTSIRSLNSIVLVLIFSAGALAFVVLYNLTNINISERVKEIATIKVLGFYDNEVSAYIYRENAVLTVIGAGVGLLLGMVLHQFVVRTTEINMVMFGRSAYPLSYLWAFLLTVGFSVLVNLVMHRRLRKISMVESMKAPE